jgi:hypothetical protein
VRYSALVNADPAGGERVTIQDLGSLGELIAAVATILTLVYLAIQIRNSSQATRFDSHLRIRQLAAESQKLLTDPALARVWRQGLDDPDSLTDDERVNFYSLMFLMVNIDDARLVYQSAIRDRSPYGTEAGTVSRMAGTPGFARWWAIAKPSYNAEMVAYVEARLAERSSGPT